MKSSWRLLTFFLVSVAAFFTSYYQNTFNIAEQNWFNTFNRFDESFIISRMVETRTAGIFSYAGMVGRVTAYSPSTQPMSTIEIDAQYQAYEENLSALKYEPYQSMIGAQGMAFSLLDRLLPLSSPDKLVFFHALNALVNAIGIAAVAAWFFLEFGPLTGVAVLLGTLLSQWLTVYGRNLFFAIWSFYLPFIASAFYLRRHDGERKFSLIRYGLLIFSTVFVKALFSGYEFVTPALVMAVVPLFYYRVKWNRLHLIRFAWSKLLPGLTVGMGAAVFAILASFVILVAQIGSISGNYRSGLSFIKYSFLKRSYDNPDKLPGEYSASLQASLEKVLSIYFMKGAYFDLNRAGDPIFPLTVNHLALVIAFAIISLILVFLPLSQIRSPDSPPHLALTAATWFSLLAPLSWLIIFKAHSYQHKAMDYIIWEMPFTLFGFALAGMLLSQIFALAQRIRRIRAVSIPSDD